MTILSTDLVFFAAETQNDESYAGGAMSANVVQDGVSANVFPLIGEADAAIGRVQLRKLYAAVLSANTDTLLNAAVHVFGPPDDAALEVMLFHWGDSATTRLSAAAALAAFPYSPDQINYGTVTGSGSTRTFSNEGSLLVGERILLGFADSGPLVSIQAIATITAISGSDVTFTITGEVIAGGAINRWSKTTPATTAAKACGMASLTAGVSGGADTVAVDRLEGRAVPDVSPYPLSPPGIDSAGLKVLGGLVPIFRVGELVQVRNVAGTTSELALVSHINYDAGELEFSSPLANAYSSGARVSSLVNLGDLQASVGSSFSQQTWTRVFSDTIIGNSIGANYNRTAAEIEVTNEGAETERWAIVFTNATDFRLIGERFGQIAAGDIETDFLPLNPITNQPYFTIQTDGWGTGWQAGNVLRFNTVGARGPFWASRTISPVPTEATDGAVFEFRGAF